MPISRFKGLMSKLDDAHPVGVFQGPRRLDAKPRRSTGSGAVMPEVDRRNLPATGRHGVGCLSGHIRPAEFQMAVVACWPA